MKPYGGKTPLSHLTCPACAQHDREKHRANKRAERRRAANDATRMEGHVDGYDEHDFGLPCCDGDCVACYSIDALDALDVFPLPPLTAPLVALALEAA